MRWAFLGPPGSGKGTQAREISREAGVPHVSTGDLLREAIASGSDLGVAVRAAVESGALVPDDLVLGVLRARLEAPDCGRGFVLDGFPRTLEQARALEAALGAEGLDAVVHFRLGEAVLLERLSGRRACPRCGASFHTRFSPPRREGRCDECGAGLVRREDDQEEAIRERFRVHRVATEPLVEHYRRRGLLREVDAAPPPAEVARQVRRALGIGTGGREGRGLPDPARRAGSGSP